ncbi:FecR family protein [Pinibacter soli]|uniref:FecR family protein n=1 Tax=Pinibacter soli TaxID=3044211 RepID=A0ABT6RDB4_9BACT|nr:FecR family protein [Pinibacter soli]MDI3320572.1 FecR family protein [Pinibacter soli]
MTNSNDRLDHLFRRYINDEATAAELQELLDIIKETPGNELADSPARELWQQLQTDQQDYSVDWNVMYSSITAESKTPVLPLHTYQKKSSRSRKWLAVSGVAAMLLISAGIYFLYNKKETPDVAVQLKSKFGNDVAPGGDKAMLTLADGSAIVLDSANNGLVAKQGNSKIEKPGNGQLVYNTEKSTDIAAIQYNTLTTPRGGQYRIVLPDGTKVWLNAASYLKFPTAFTGDKRNVELKGEAYFEVAQNAEQPFEVAVNNMQVQVLGTSFNINCYDDESSIKTSLIEGKVKVVSENNASILAPGHEAIMNKNTNDIKVAAADVEDAIAWKNNVFSFQNADIPTIMRQIARWYDVEISYEGKVPTEKFVGEVSRNSNVSEVLKILELNKVHFKIDGKKITVLP